MQSRYYYLVFIRSVSRTAIFKKAYLVESFRGFARDLPAEGVDSASDRIEVGRYVGAAMMRTRPYDQNTAG